MNINKKTLLLLLIPIAFVTLIILFFYFTNYGTVTVTTTPQNTTLKLDNKAYISGTKVRAGKHILSISKSGYITTVKEISVARDKTLSENITLAKAPSANELRMRENLPFENEHFKIEFDPNSDSYTISLYAILNGDSQLPLYKQEMVQYKNEAFAWIKSNGVNSNDLLINWLPEDPNKYN